MTTRTFRQSGAFSVKGFAMAAFTALCIAFLGSTAHAAPHHAPHSIAESAIGVDSDTGEILSIF